MVAGAHAHQFFRDVAKNKSVWTLGTSKGPITFESHGTQVMALFSTRKRAEKLVATAPGYEKFVVLGISWPDFERLWRDVLNERAIHIGLNWSGSRANGFEMPANAVFESVRAASSELPNKSLERTRAR
jgi:hypothetical protein